MSLSKMEKQAVVESFQPYHKGFYTTATIDRAPFSKGCLCSFPPRCKTETEPTLKDALTHKHKPQGTRARLLPQRVSHCQNDICTDTYVSAATYWYFPTNNMRLWPVSQILRKLIHQLGIFYHCPRRRRGCCTPTQSYGQLAAPSSLHVHLLVT